MRFFFFFLFFGGRLVLQGVVTTLPVIGITLCRLIGISFWRDMLIGIACFIYGVKSRISITLLDMLSDGGNAVVFPVRREDAW